MPPNNKQDMQDRKRQDKQDIFKGVLNFLISLNILVFHLVYPAACDPAYLVITGWMVNRKLPKIPVFCELLSASVVDHFLNIK